MNTMTEEKKNLAGAEEIQGTIQRIFFAKPSWSSGVIRCKGKDHSFTIKGFVKAGEPVTLRGKWTTHAKYGRQFEGSEVVYTLPADPQGLTKWLEWYVPCVGAVKAQKLIDEFGLDLPRFAAEDPQQVAIVGHIAIESIHRIAEAWKEYGAKIAAMSELASFGLSQHQVEVLWAKFKASAVTILREDPYLLLREVEGFGFKTVDEIARKLGYPESHPGRKRAAYITAVADAKDNDGSTAIREPVAVEDACGMLELPVEEYGCAVLQMAEEAAGIGQIRRINDGDEKHPSWFVGLPSQYRYEELLWKTLATAADRNPNLSRIGDSPLSFVAENYNRIGDKELDADQLAAVVMAAKNRLTFITGGAGSGKCLGKGTPVMLASGEIVPVEQVKEGDSLMGPDSYPRLVVSINKGIGPLYRITPVKGEPWVCNDVHMMTLKGTNRKMGQIIDVELRAHLQQTQSRPDRNWKLFKVGVRFSSQPVPFDPYLLGVWLGDGSSNEPHLNLGPKKVAVRDYAMAAATEIGMTARIENDSRSPGLQKIKFRVGEQGQQQPNPFRRYCKDQCLDSHGLKIIPDCYIRNSRSVQLSVLAALIDTDGSLSGGGYDWCSNSPTLANQVVFLCRSLGYAAYMSPKEVRLEGWDEPRTYYRVSISGDLTDLPLKVDSKKAPARKQIKDVQVTGWKADPIGDGEYYGFTLTGDGRFLLGDFTVTHNTLVARAITKVFADAGVTVQLCAPTGKAARRLQEVIGREASTIHRLLGFRGASFEHDQNNPLPDGVVIVDELSMVDSELAYHLFKAISPKTSVVCIGDPNQLPPVGAGALLRDVLNHGLAPIARLNQCHRQAGPLKANCAAILDGRIERSWMENKSGAAPWMVHDALTLETQVIKAITVLTEKYLPEWGYDPIADTQFLTAKHAGELGTKYLNKVCQRLRQRSLGNEMDTPEVSDDTRAVLFTGER